ncbi:MAG: aldo/keto reductase [Lentisphaeria bacterium]|nr:aldo/keto reductase [Lentisphaeria bacterium]
MRLPRVTPGKPEIDYVKTAAMFDKAMKAGVNYFDTAYFYHAGLSEKCAGDLLSKYPRDSYMLASKMPVGHLRKAADIERIFNEQLKKCKTAYFDFYMLHALNGRNWEKAKRLKVYEFLMQKKAEGKIRKLGFSFHDTPAVLEKIASAYPWDFAQIQVNYLDWTLYRSKEQYEILTKKNIPVIVMEPLRGGALAKLNPAATKILKNMSPKESNASWAFRYVGSLPNVLITLSGMTQMEHLEDNIKTFTNFRPLTETDKKVLNAALTAYRKSLAVPCTDCRYCLPCPAGVEIPKIFGLYNQLKLTGNRANFNRAYNAMDEDAQASACVACGKCVKACPQKINIPEELKKIDQAIKRSKRRAALLSPEEDLYA